MEDKHTGKKKEKNKCQSREAVMSESGNANHVGGKREENQRSGQTERNLDGGMKEENKRQEVRDRWLCPSQEV